MYKLQAPLNPESPLFECSHECEGSVSDHFCVGLGEKMRTWTVELTGEVVCAGIPKSKRPFFEDFSRNSVVCDPRLLWGPLIRRDRDWCCVHHRHPYLRRLILH